MLRSVKQRVRSHLRRPILAASELTAILLNRYVPGNAAHDIFYKHGFHLLRKSYYLPIPDKADLDCRAWDKRSELVGIEMNDGAALKLLGDVFPPYIDEFRASFPDHQAAGSRGLYLINGAFMAIDAHVYYAFIRHLKPRRIVEIGSGFSTLVAAAAGMRSREEGGQIPHLVAVDPFPPAFLKGFPGVSEIIEAKVQNMPLDLFTSLEAGDIVFIDSTHVLKAGGDVQFEYCEVLPRLRPGVLVHVHDISLPQPYPRVYFEENHFYWNEQYVLQAFLTYNSRFEVLWPGNYIMLKYPDMMRRAFPEYDVMRRSFPRSEPSSFWLRVKQSEHGRAT